MKSNKKVFLPIIILVLIISSLFLLKTSPGVNFTQSASISSALALINEGKKNLATYTLEQKQQLIKEIDREATAIRVELNLLNQDLNQLNLRKETIESQSAADASQISSLNLRITLTQNQIDSQQSRLGNLKRQLQSKNEQCAKISTANRANCRSQASGIQSQISSTSSTISQKRSELNSLRTQISEIQSRTKQSQIQTLNSEINQKKQEINKTERFIQDLNNFRLQIINSTNNDSEGDKNVEGVIYGCTDINASNWNSMAVIDDGSCEYQTCFINDLSYSEAIRLIDEILYEEGCQSSSGHHTITDQYGNVILIDDIYEYVDTSCEEEKRMMLEENIASILEEYTGLDNSCYNEYQESSGGASR